jgi:hypothetical protein
MAIHTHSIPLILACCVAVASCDRDAPRASTQVASASSNSDSGKLAEPAAFPSSDTIPLGVHRADELVDAAETVIAFLRGEVGFERIRVADTITLYLAPEAGGTRRALSRAELRNRSNWRVRMRSLPNAPAHSYSFVPHKGKAELETRVGRHLKCLEYPLSSIYPELARFPHVGTKLVHSTASCLNTENLTLVFDPNEKPPTLIAAVYDQWEW